MNDYYWLNLFNPAYMPDECDDAEGLEDDAAALATDEALGK